VRLLYFLHTANSIRSIGIWQVKEIEAVLRVIIG
jgi:hypothetical protein